jgi:membrane protease YdiL (CAAX protease family)
VLIFALIWKNHPDLALGDAPIPPPWDWPAGLSVLVRAALFGIAISLVLRFLDAQLATEVFTLRGSVLVWAPMLWYMHRRLLRPAHLGFQNAFGFSRALSKPLLCVATALGLLALDRVGASALQVLAANLGERPHWTERVLEEWIWAPLGVAAFGILDVVLFVPLFEELGCRGLLYTSLRRRLGPWSAAIFSAGLFALIHPYGMAGMLDVFWQSFIYSSVYERTRSLLPLCLCHVLHNLFALTAGWMLYR